MFQHESETLDEQQQHARGIHSTILSSQERIAKNMASSHERIAASSEPTMQTVLTALTGYRNRSDSSNRAQGRSRSASPARREA